MKHPPTFDLDINKQVVMVTDTFFLWLQMLGYVKYASNYLVYEQCT